MKLKELQLFIFYITIFFTILYTTLVYIQQNKDILLCIYINTGLHVLGTVRKEST